MQYRLPKGSKLDQRDKQKLKMVIRKKQTIPETVQDTIPVKWPYRDGTFLEEGGIFSRTLVFDDIDYRVAPPVIQDTIFDQWCSLQNSFPPEAYITFTYLNSHRRLSDLEMGRLKGKGDHLDFLRKDLNSVIRDQQMAGGKGMQRSRYLTFGLADKNLESVRPRLLRMQGDLMKAFAGIGAGVQPLNGKDRLKVLHDVMHLEERDEFRFDWNWVAGSGLSPKDFIVPDGMQFKERCFLCGKTWYAASFLQMNAAEFSNHMLTDFLDAQTSQVVSIKIQAVDKEKAHQMVGEIISDLDSAKIKENQTAMNRNYDIDIVPEQLKASIADAKEFGHKLRSNEYMFLATVLILNTGRTQKELENRVESTAAIARRHNCALKRLTYQQEQAFCSCLPLARNQIGIKRSLSTTALGIMLPFTTKELRHDSAEALFYGINKLSGNALIIDRKQGANGNGLCFGLPGHGKSVFMKLEIILSYLLTQDDILINDPEGEYAPVVEKLGGQVIRLGMEDCLNPMEIDQEYVDKGDPIRDKTVFMLAYIDRIMSPGYMYAEERAVVDTAMLTVCRRYFEHPDPEQMPVLGDLQAELRAMRDKDADHIAAVMEPHVTGTMKDFNRRTNVDVKNRLVCFDLSGLEGLQKKNGMATVQDHIWRRSDRNLAKGRHTRYYADEMHLFFQDASTADFVLQIWKRIRKRGGIPLGATQNVKALLNSPVADEILNNTQFMSLFSLEAEDREELAVRLKLSQDQLGYITNKPPGEGLLRFRDSVIPFSNHLSEDSELYKLISTKLEDVAARRKAQMTDNG